MINLIVDNNGIIFNDAYNKPRRLIDFMNPVANQSDLPQSNLVNEVQVNLQKLMNGTPEGMINGMVFLRIVARLMRKPQIHNSLHIGQWSQLDDVLAMLLPKFNEKNFLWNYLQNRPIGRFENVNFIFTEVNGGGVLPSRK